MIRKKMSEVGYIAIKWLFNRQGCFKKIFKNNVLETQLAYWGRKIIVAFGLKSTTDKLPTSYEIYAKLFGPVLGT